MFFNLHLFYLFLQLVNLFLIQNYVILYKSATCREKGANEQYKNNLENNKTQVLYRRIYRQKFMIAQRNKDSKHIQKDFDKWKKEAKEKINQMKKGKITEDGVYNWLVENK